MITLSHEPLRLRRYPIWRNRVTRWWPRWDGQDKTPRLRLHLRRRRGRRPYHRCGPLKLRIGRWYLLRVERGTGGPYSYDWFYWIKCSIGALSREPVTRCYSVDW